MVRETAKRYEYINQVKKHSKTKPSHNSTKAKIDKAQAGTQAYATDTLDQQNKRHPKEKAEKLCSERDIALQYAKA